MTRREGARRLVAVTLSLPDAASLSHVNIFPPGLRETLKCQARMWATGRISSENAGVSARDDSSRWRSPPRMHSPKWGRSDRGGGRDSGLWVWRLTQGGGFCIPMKTSSHEAFLSTNQDLQPRRVNSIKSGRLGVGSKVIQCTSCKNWNSILVLDDLQKICMCKLMVKLIY